MKEKRVDGVTCARVQKKDGSAWNFPEGPALQRAEPDPPSPLTDDHCADGQQDEGVPTQEAQHMLARHGLQAQARAQRSLLQTLLQPLQPAYPAQPLAALPQKQAVSVAAHLLSAGDREALAR